VKLRETPSAAFATKKACQRKDEEPTACLPPPGSIVATQRDRTSAVYPTASGEAFMLFVAPISAACLALARREGATLVALPDGRVGWIDDRRLVPPC
jgi:hypothetical protein